jgi:hypothetical protein
MNKHKRILAVLCLVCGLAQAPANAQATGSEVLIGLGAKLIPIVLPFVLATIPLAINATVAIPAYVRERMPSMHMPGRKKKPNESDKANTPEEKTEGTADSGQESEGEKKSVAAAPAEPAVQVSAKPPAEQEPKVVVREEPKPRDETEWFLGDDEKDLHQRRAAAHHKHKTGHHSTSKTTESVKGEVLNAPAETEQVSASSPAAGEAAAPLPSSEPAPAPVIMMKVAD